MCSYCGCRTNTEIARYTREHEVILDTMGELRRASAAADTARMQEIVAILASQLEPHTLREERSLFAEMRKEEEFREHIDGLCAEHTSLDALVARIATGEHAAVEVLYEALWRHIDKEENGLFPAAIIAIDGPTWERIVALAEVNSTV